MHATLKRHLHSSQGDLAEVVKKFKYLQRDRIIELTYTEGMNKITTGLEFIGPLWAQVRGYISYYALSRVRKYMVALDLSGDTILKPYTTTFEQAWGLPCPHLVLLRRSLSD